jgi:hypothetical protein
MDRIVATSTTDSADDVRAALGVIETPAEPVPAPATEPAATEPPAADPVQAPAADTPAPDAAEPAAESAELEDVDDDDEGDDDATAAVVSEAGRTLAKQRVPAKVRIARLTREKHDSARARDEALAEIDRLKAQLATKPAEPPPAAADTPPAPASGFDKPKPKQDDFEDFDAYLTARDEWVSEKTSHDVEQRLEARQQERDAAAAKQQAETEARERQQVFETRLSAAKEQHADFDEVVAANKDLLVPAIVLHHMTQVSEVGPELIYHLATHPDVAKGLMALRNDGAALVALGKIEAAIESARTVPAAPAPTAPRPKPVAVSKAPPPVTTVNTGATTAGAKNPDDMTMREYNEWRDAQDARKRAAG